MRGRVTFERVVMERCRLVAWNDHHRVLTEFQSANALPREILHLVEIERERGKCRRSRRGSLVTNLQRL